MTTATAQVFRLPDLGEGLTEAEVVRWLVAVGDEVAIDQAIVEVETAKSIVEVPSPYAGRVAILHAAEGQTLDVHAPLITIDPSGVEATPADIYREEEKAGSGNVLIGYGTPGGPGNGRRRRPRAKQADLARAGSVPARRAVPLVISPLVRTLAREHEVDLTTVDPTRAGGVISRADVERHIATLVEPNSRDSTDSGDSVDARDSQDTRVGPVTLGGGERRIPLSGFRKAVSAALSRSRSEIPEATVWVDVDATPLWDLRESARTATDTGPGLMAYLARFVVAALKEYPVFNARIDTQRDEIVELDAINLGIAVQGERGLVVPAVIGAGSLTTARLDEEIRAATRRAREGRSTQEELSVGTFTLNNYGSFRIDGSAAIINHPQVAILGFGRVMDRPWVLDGEICVRKISQMSFVFDHRVCDGGTAAGFMRSVADAVENPGSAIARL